MLVETLQEISRRRAVRFSFISGDVHCCGLGQLYSIPKVGAYPVKMQASAMPRPCALNLH